MFRTVVIAAASAAILTLSPTAFAQTQFGTAEPVRAAETTLPVAVLAGSPEERRAWAQTMHRTPAPKEGCFQASYPSTQWREVQCAPPPGWRSAPPRKLIKREGGNLEVGGTGGGTPLNNDIVVQAPAGHLLSSATGSFLPQTAGVTSESSVGVPAFGGGGFLGANEYSLQVNTNIAHSAACGSFAPCQAWQQYVFATNTTASISSSTPTNLTQVFIEYWLFNYGVHNGSDICPAGFLDNGASVFGTPGDDCVQNTPANTVFMGQLPITNLVDLILSGSATANGTDVATATFNGQAYTASVQDSLTGISGIWNQAEFNVVGNAGGSQAVFNNGASVWVQVAVTDGSPSAPTCAFNGGTTGESNNLNFVPSTMSPVCCPYGGANPRIEFIEVSSGSPITTASCGSSGVWGEPHITTLDGNYYNFQAAGEFIALQDPDGTEIQTRQTPIPTLAPGNYDPGNLDNDELVSCLAMNTAVAAKVGSHRVTYEPAFTSPYASGPFQLRIDGKLTTLGAQGVSLGGGGQVKNSSEGGGIEVDFPDGKIMTAIPAGSYASMNLLNVSLANLGLVTEPVEATVSGLASAFAKGSWLPALPNGTSVGPMPSALHDRYVTLYDTFANAWRVKQSNSLFDYAPNTSTSTFTNAAWPVENAKTCTIPNQTAVAPVSAAVAKVACRSVTDKALYASCVFDVQATGHNGFAETYLLTERVHSALKIRPIDLRRQVVDVK
jgi:hypothetical protein